jgi:hypothetical protein
LSVVQSSLHPLVAFGHGYQKRNKSPMIVLFWLTSILAIEAYAIFSNLSLGLTLAYRMLNFLWPPLAIFSASGLYRLYAANRPQIPAKLAAIIVLVAIVILNFYNVHASISLEERYLGYFWLYRFQEYKAGVWITETVDDQIISGDIKGLLSSKQLF